MKKLGISLVALVITIVVLVILTGAIIMTGINAPQQAQLAVFKSNVGAVQDAVTMKMLNNMAEYSREGNVELYKWVGVVSGYTTTDAEGGTAPTITITDKIPDVRVAQVDSSIGNNLSESDVSKYYVDANGIVYHEGQVFNGVTYYNTTKTFVEVSSIIVTTPPTKTTYYEEETFDPTGMVVTVAYPDGTTQAITEGYTCTPNTALATTDTSITITYGGKTTTQAITVTTPTLGDLISNDVSCLGKTINYSANGKTDWQILYEDEESGYVYIIAQSSIGNVELSITWCGGVEGFNEKVAMFTPAFSAGYTPYTLNSESDNSKAVSWLMTDSQFTVYGIPTNTNITSYVKGAIGGPTIELYSLAWNVVGDKTVIPLPVTGGDGYNVSGFSDIDGLSTETFLNSNRYYFWLASPASSKTSFVMGAGYGGMNNIRYYGEGNAVRPVVCLDSNIPAREKQDSDPADTKDIVITVSQPE